MLGGCKVSIINEALRRRCKMLILLIFAVTFLLAFADAGIVRLFRRRRAGRSWWCALAVAWLVGAWGGFFFEYRPTPVLRVFGAPVPGVFLHWEGPLGEERWVDFNHPGSGVFAGSNIVILALLAVLSVGLVFVTEAAVSRFKREV
jgi:hypothetical protein